MDKQRCDYLYKNGKICGAKIHIECNDDRNRFKCYKHINKVNYVSKRKREGIKNTCMGYRKYGTQIIPCKELRKKNSNYCRHHHKPLSNPSLNNALFNYYFNKILFEDIKKEHSLYLDNQYLDKEINVLSNIDYKNDYNIDFINIRYNAGLCLNQNDNMSFICDNPLKDGEDYCKECLYNISLDDNSLILDNEDKNRAVITSDILCTKKDNINYYDDNIKKKKRKIIYEKNNDNSLNHEFSFKYLIEDYYINNIKKNNKKFLIKILEYNIDIRNYIYKLDKIYKYNSHLNIDDFLKICIYILNISDKILDLIDEMFSINNPL